MTLSDVVLNPHSIAPNAFIYAIWPWTPESEALIQLSSKNSNQFNSAYRLFLDMKVVLRLAQLFQYQNLCHRICIEKTIEFAQQQYEQLDQNITVVQQDKL